MTINSISSSNIISTIIFDVDDTLYDVSSGFTAHRNGEVIWNYMVEHYRFENIHKAKAVRDKYFKIYHSTAKALTVAQAEGEFPPGAPKFDAKHMSQYWVDHLDYDKLWGTQQGGAHNYNSNSNSNMDDAKRSKQELRDSLARCPAKLVAFSNGPRSYVIKVLDKLGLLDLFGSESSNNSDNANSSSNLNCNDGAFIWGVDDVLPHCKPEPEAFQKIFDKLSKSINDINNGNNNIKINPEECIMVEDSMKNVRAAKALGMKTILITGSREEGRILPGDAPTADDPAVDVAFATIEEMTTRLPGLWKNPPVFEP